MREGKDCFLVVIMSIGFICVHFGPLNIQSGNQVTLQTIALEDTSIKIGPARKRSCKGKMARRSKRSKWKDSQDRSGELLFLNSHIILIGQCYIYTVGKNFISSPAEFVSLLTYKKKKKKKGL